jgi:hypothetical protein
VADALTRCAPFFGNECSSISVRSHDMLCNL